MNKEELKKQADKVMTLGEFENLDIDEWYKGTVRRAVHWNGYHCFTFEGEKMFVEEEGT